MDLSSPIGSLIPSLDAPVLEVLAGTESALGVSQIHRLARRGARSGVHRVLDRLVEQGLVSAEPTNLGHVYRLNRDHVLAAPVMTAVGARAEFFDRLTRACELLEPSVVSAAMFGSTARRESGTDSDIDLLLVVHGDDHHGEEWRRQMNNLEDRVLAWTGNRLECVTLDDEALRSAVQADEPIIQAWLDEAVTLTGMSVATLIESVRPGNGAAR